MVLIYDWLIFIKEVITQFLNIVIFENNYFFINFWSVVHLITGFLIMLVFIKKFKFKFIKSFIWLFILLIFWEIFEYMFYSTSEVIFKAETKLDVIWDIIIGMFGGAFSFKLKGIKRQR